MNEIFSYDQVPYPTNDFQQSGPDRMATMATLFSLHPPPPEQCRVLELGCGTGANLLSFAYTLPESRFVGVDLSAVQIDEANKAAARIGVENAEFRRLNIMDHAIEELGEFDYIIAHGLLSWVPEPVRERVFQIYANCLSPHGIGYISYNVFPGWHTRSIIRELMLYHTAAIEDPLERVDEALNIVGFLTDTARPGSRYHEILKFERDSLARVPRQGLLHDVMEADNQPFYFHEFVEKLSAYGLQFLAEAEPNGLAEDDLSPDTLEVLNEIGTDEIRRQQYLDFIRACRFRCSLICRTGLKIERSLTPEVTGKFLISGCVNTESIDLTDSSAASFSGPRNAKFSTNHPLSKAALVYLNYRWPNSVTFGELENNLKELFKDLPKAEFDASIHQLKAFLLQLFKAEIVQFRSFQPRFVDKVTEFPRASEYARWQIAMNRKKVTTLSGISLEVEDEIVRTTLVLLDGSRDHETLLRDLCEAAEGQGADKEVLYASLSAQIDSTLSSIAKVGLLIG